MKMDDLTKLVSASGRIPDQPKMHVLGLGDQGIWGRIGSPVCVLLSGSISQVATPMLGSQICIKPQLLRGV